MLEVLRPSAMLKMDVLLSIWNKSYKNKAPLDFCAHHKERETVTHITDRLIQLRYQQG